jgi:hypothetical protein
VSLPLLIGERRRIDAAPVIANLQPEIPKAARREADAARNQQSPERLCQLTADRPTECHRSPESALGRVVQGPGGHYCPVAGDTANAVRDSTGEHNPSSNRVPEIESRR